MLSQVPSWLGQLVNLTVLELGHNALTGTFPRELGQLSSLEELVLSSNQLSGPLPPELAGMARVGRGPTLHAPRSNVHGLVHGHDHHRPLV